MLVALLLWTTLTVPPASDDAPTAGASREPLDPALQAIVDRLPQATGEELAAAVRKLLESRDDRVLPSLLELLARPGDEHARLRKLVITGIVETFPVGSEALLVRLLTEGTPPQRETVAYALSLLPGVETLDLQVRLLDDADPKVGAGALYALLTPGRVLSGQAQGSLFGGRPGPPEADIERHRLVQARVLERLLTQPAVDATLGLTLARKLLDPAGTARVREAYCAALAAEPAQAELAAVLRRLFDATRGWLGRPSLPALARLGYTMTMDNLVAQKSQEVRVDASPQELDWLRYNDIRIDRASVLELPLDLLAIYPAACEPSLLPRAEDGALRLRYRIPPRQALLCGHGLHSVFYWQGRLGTAVHAELELDAAHGTPRREQLFGPAGELLATVDYEKFETPGSKSSGDKSPGDKSPGEEAAAGSADANDAWFPGRIRVEIPRTDAPVRHMKYVFDFQQRDGFWVLREATAFEVEAGRDIARSAVAIASLTTTAHPPAGE